MAFKTEILKHVKVTEDADDELMSNGEASLAKRITDALTAATVATLHTVQISQINENEVIAVIVYEDA